MALFEVGKNNVDMTTGGTPYSYLIRGGVVDFFMRLRSGNGFLVSSESGGIAAGDYETVNAGEGWEVKLRGVTTDQTIYFQAVASSEVMEIEEKTV